MRFFTMLIIIIIISGLVAGFYTSASMQLPGVDTLGTPAASTLLLDCKGREFAALHAVENRVPVKISEMPRYLTEAVVSIEDERFYSHFGVDIPGIARALFRDITSMRIEEGASTITQQLARNAYLGHEQTVLRKIREIFLAIRIEQKYSKDEILQMYLNQVYYGRGAYGVQAAAREYFNKDVSRLDLPECAWLAGLPQSPNYYSEAGNSGQSLQRMQLVLSKMLERGCISSGQYDTASRKLPSFASPSPDGGTGYLTEYFTELLSERYGANAVYCDGMNVYTTINIDFQHAAEKALQLIPAARKDKNGLLQPQAALVCIDNSNGQIRAMVGGRGLDKFNRVILSKRQPGSAIKPFVYYTALAGGMTPESRVIDQPVSYAGYSPSNYDNKFHGAMSLRQALANSYNTVAVQLANSNGVNNIQSVLRNCGISSIVTEGPANDNNLALALGGLTEGVIPAELAGAYSTLANYGLYREPHAIAKILARDGETLYEYKTAPKQVLNKEACIMLVDMMQDVVKYGTGAGSAIDRPSAGKTGTTSDHKDAWFAGFTPEYTTLVWMGNDDNQSLGKLTGGDYPATVWRQFMQIVTAGSKPAGFLTVPRKK